MRNIVEMSRWLLLVVIVSGCQMMGGPTQQVPLASARDIRATGADALNISIRRLPIQQYPLLAKFTRVRRIDIFDPKASATSDGKLRAIADLNFTNLVDINLLNGRLVTDDGIRALTRIASLKMLQLEGTSITDAGCEVMASQMKLAGVNVANCSKVTLKGLQRLAVSDTIWDFGFSADTLTTQEVIDLIRSFKAINWCQIVDLDGKLDANAIKNAGAERGIKVFVRRGGALQNMLK